MSGKKFKERLGNYCQQHSVPYYPENIQLFRYITLCHYSNQYSIFEWTDVALDYESINHCLGVTLQPF